MTTEPTVPVSLLARVHHLEFQIGQMKITRSNDVDRMVTTMKSLSERISRLEDRLHGIESGEPPTGKSTTPTCGPIESGNPDICPTCGHRLRPLTPAEKQRNYRNRQKGKT